MRPIIFNPENIVNILTGKKTMTRRVIEPQPEFPTMEYVRKICPYGYPAHGTAEQPMLMWVQEKWCGGRRDPNNPLRYYLDFCSYRDGICEFDHQYEGTYQWQSAVNMPYWASRFFLGILDVRVEHLQQITHADVVKEGVESIDEFKVLWDSINSVREYGWYENPLVYAIEFNLWCVKDKG